MSNSAINSALSGLSSAQIALDTTGNNIANVNVQGYSRQSTVLQQANSTYNGAGWIGNGVQVVAVRRDYNDFITRQLREAQTINSQMTTRYQQMTKIDDMVASSNNVAGSLQDFFASLQVLVSNADDAAARQTVLGKADALINQFKVTDDYLRNQNKQINSQISATVEQINAYASQIANLNKRISQLSAIAGGDSPNDLLDQRDMLVGELNKLTRVEIMVQDAKSFTVSVGNGYTLVQGESLTKLMAVPSSGDPARLTMAYVDQLAGPVAIPETMLTQGSLGGLLSFRSQDLDQVHNRINQLALVFADSFNRQHMQGVDLEGDTGTAFFNTGEPQVLPDDKNKSATALTASITSTQQIQAANYQLRFDASKWTVHRIPDNAPVSFTATPATGAPDSVEFDGLTIRITGTPENGDQFIVKPVADVINSMSLAVTDSARIALGIGDGENGASDNRNGQMLLNLQNAKTVNGKKSFNDSWAGIISDVGNKTKVTQITNDTQTNLVKQLTKQQQSISGVNLDEEYGNLQHFQQYYLANAKALQTASTLFDALLSAIR